MPCEENDCLHSGCVEQHSIESYYDEIIQLDRKCKESLGPYNIEAYSDESIQLEGKYQELMDWSVWLHEYKIRSDMNKEESDKLFSSDPYLNGQFWNADSILHVILEKKNLCSIAFMANKGIQKHFFCDNPREAIGGNVDSIGLSDYDIGLNKILLTAGDGLKSLPKTVSNAEPHQNLQIVALNFSLQIEMLQKQIEELWLDKQGRHLEADIVRFARIFNKNSWVKSDANISRAIGLWLWDYIHYPYGKGKRPSQYAARRAFLEKYPREAHRDDRDLRSFYKKTKKCIELGEVLPFTKSNKGTKSPN